MLHDLNLDQVIDALQTARPRYPIADLYRSPVHDVETVQYRQDVFRDLDVEIVHGAVCRFTAALQKVDKRLEASRKSHFPRQRHRWILDAVLLYCRTVERFEAEFTAASIRSRGLLAVREGLSAYLLSREFSDQYAQAEQLLAHLDAVRYAVLIRGTRITVGLYDDEENYSEQVQGVFARFQQGPVEDHHSGVTVGAMSRVEAEILDQVARVFPGLFSRLEGFCAAHEHCVDDAIRQFDHELQFYLAYLAYLAPLRRAGLPTCYPAVAPDSKETRADDIYDIALATKLVAARVPVVVNDLVLTGPERILVVSGPNQGGKTTLARAFGQLHHLAGLGCPVPGTEVHVLLADAVITHFEREEELETLAGKLEDDLIRVRAVLERATAHSVIIMNEVFASTTLQDAVWLSIDILRRIQDLDALCVCVTFLDELSTLSEKTVSMVSTVAEDDPARRTYRLMRRPADGRAYAMAVAEKYGLTYDALRERIST